ncbi:extensin-like [Haliotis rubra]|uniref:extensin-like n=1 Tax=Haliotis rubra TaxID=36100 RepID=UPI001EE5393F|nr:extensin-like [Haliotis rubra]
MPRPLVSSSFLTPHPPIHKPPSSGVVLFPYTTPSYTQVPVLCSRPPSLHHTLLYTSPRPLVPSSFLTPHPPIHKSPSCVPVLLSYIILSYTQAPVLWCRPLSLHRILLYTRPRPLVPSSFLTPHPPIHKPPSSVPVLFPYTTPSYTQAPILCSRPLSLHHTLLYTSPRPLFPSSFLTPHPPIHKPPSSGVVLFPYTTPSYTQAPALWCRPHSLHRILLYTRPRPLVPSSFLTPHPPIHKFPSCVPVLLSYITLSYTQPRPLVSSSFLTPHSPIHKPPSSGAVLFPYTTPSYTQAPILFSRPLSLHHTLLYTSPRPLFPSSFLTPNPPIHKPPSSGVVLFPYITPSYTQVPVLCSRPLSLHHALLYTSPRPLMSSSFLTPHPPIHKPPSSVPIP